MGVVTDRHVLSGGGEGGASLGSSGRFNVLFVKLLVVELLLLEDQSLDLLHGEVIQFLRAASGLQLVLNLGVELLDIRLVSSAYLGLDKVEQLLLQLVVLAGRVLFEGDGLLSSGVCLVLLLEVLLSLLPEHGGGLSICAFPFLVVLLLVLTVSPLEALSVASLLRSTALGGLLNGSRRGHVVEVVVFLLSSLFLFDLWLLLCGGISIRLSGETSSCAQLSETL